VLPFGRKRLFLLALLPIVLASCHDEPRPGAVAPPRGIVLVTVDGWWDPATKTDSIPEDFGATPLRLTNAMTPCPQVRPAVASILTGKSPVETGVRDDVVTPLPAGVALVSETLSAKGWRTAAFVADPRVGRQSGLERGFEIFDAPKEPLLGPFRRLPKVRDPGEIVSDFATWIPTVPDDASFFVWIHLSRPAIDPPAEGSAQDVHAALSRLSQLLAGSARLKGASLMLVGTAGRTDLDDGGSSGYFLNAGVLRVPVLVRSSRSGAGTLDPHAPFSLIAAAGWIASEAGVAAPSPDSGALTSPRIAWTWRGHTEFGWPVEVAAQSGTALCVRGIPGSEDVCAPWAADRPIDDVDREACAVLLVREAELARSSSPLPALPVELAQKVKQLGIQPPVPRAETGAPVARETRERLVPSITRARRLADHGKAVDADASYQAALKLDPGNFGALIEAGEALALEGHAKMAKKRLEPAMRFVPWNAEAWHWTGHVSYLDGQLDRAEAQWSVSDVLEPDNADVIYDLACARSLAGDSAGAEGYLRRAWKLGFTDVNKIQVDPDLRNLRADPAYLRFMREVVR
jgi:hypothetical protein